MRAAPSRRDVLSAAVAASVASLLGATGPAAAAQLKFGPAKSFSFSGLVGRARDMAAKAYLAPRKPAPEIVDQIGYEQHGKIKFRSDHALFSDEKGVYPVTFFPVGKYFPKTIKMHAVDGDKAAEVLYEPEYFDMPDDSPAAKLPEDTGFAGFQIREAKSRPDWTTKDWCAFLGASYFRAIGSLGEYGLSARGVTVDTASPKPEEFPDFTEFYLQPASAETQPVVVYALLDGPSITGAYKFTIRRTEGVIIDVECNLFVRKDIGKLGISPMTSMYWFSNYDKSYQLEWREGAHDSDGLAMWTGAGERIWRPLVNPPGPSTSAFVDDNPRGFGLMQRDRDPQHYMDRYLNYERRPSLWIEPIGGWGQGAFHLVEFPTDHEDFDNIGCFWVPKEPVKAGQSLEFRYRMYWNADEPNPPNNLARPTATRIGRGGFPYSRVNPPELKRMVIEFSGGPLDGFPKDRKPEPVITASRGQISSIFLETTTWNKAWRLQFDIKAEGPDPVDLRAYLRDGDTALTETWLFKLHPQKTW
ncbi:glucan biosynthesis protein [Pinisolibacter aquiterrae]|uniref:glucan biosynthesis protein n=1 Tax=Pinisolibacter aquiterrae TaxID=2815579 RepID=UPI001C3E5A00|nr:glucan biosynthesis protein D [Pinisolibacter aquiterrae]MBV5263628.1 glucan biosynthesis protein [Pinisolibacter aquiterrae]MCC8235174.1 glucan biosynthesis protein [Pinisolibacter aquiterrae]